MPTNVINLSTASELDIVCRRGNTLSVTIEVNDLDDNGQVVPVDFNSGSYSASTAKMHVKRSPSSTTPALIFTTAEGISLTTGYITLYKTAAAMSIPPGNYVYDFNLIRPIPRIVNGATIEEEQVSTWFRGKFIVEKNITN